jgi:hypothetical protein
MLGKAGARHLFPNHRLRLRSFELERSGAPMIIEEQRPEDAMSEARVTIDHAKIRRWAEQRGGHPATVKATSADSKAGILRLDFDPKDESLKDVSWDEFFHRFDEEKLAFLHQDKTSDGKVSRFHKFVDRDSATKK